MSGISWKVLCALAALSALAPGSPLHAAGTFRAPVRVCGGCNGLDMDLDASGNPIIAFVSRGRLYFSSGRERFEAPVEVDGPATDPESPAIAAGPLTGVFIAFSAVGPDGDREIFGVRSPGGPFLPPENLSRMPGIDRAPSLTIGPSGEPSVAWTHEGPGGGDVVFASTWGALGLPVASGEAARVTADGEGRFHFAYVRGGDVFYARGLPFSIVEQNVSRTPDRLESQPRVAVDPEGTPYVAYLREGEVWLTGRTFSEGQWLNADLGLADGLSLFVTPASILALAFSTEGDAYSRIAPYGMAIPPARISDGWGAVRRPKLVFGPRGTRHLAFEAGGEGWYSNDAEAPRAAFEATPTRGEAPLRVAFAQRATGVVTRWIWDFGDGGSGNRPDPVHVYRRPGRYTVRLTVLGIAGERDTAVEEGLVEVLEPDNLLWIEDIVVITGQKGVEVSVYAAHPDPIQGFQLAARFDPALAAVRELRLSSIVTRLHPEFFVPQIDADEGIVTAGVILDSAPPFDGRRISGGIRQRLAGLVVDVASAAKAGHVTWLRLEDELGTPPISNILIVDGRSVHPGLAGGRIEVVPFWPPFLRLFRRGDVNDDGGFAISDPIFLLNWLFAGGRDPACLDAADVDDSGAIDIGDAINALRFLFMGDFFPPYPHFSYGLDPTPDPLGECR